MIWLFVACMSNPLLEKVEQNQPLEKYVFNATHINSSLQLY
jgi:hypothetical protein